MTKEIIESKDYTITLMKTIESDNNHHYLEIEIEYKGNKYAGIAESQTQALKEAKLKAIIDNIPERTIENVQVGDLIIVNELNCYSNFILQEIQGEKVFVSPSHFMIKDKLKDIQIIRHEFLELWREFNE